MRTSCPSFLHSMREPVRIPVPVIVEVGYLLGSRFGSEAEALYLDSVGWGGIQIEDPLLEDYVRAAELERRYA